MLQHNSLLMNFPNRTTPIGNMINDYLLNKTDLSNEAIHLLFSANRWESMNKISETLNSGVHIICDRYWYSGVAYSVAKGMDFQWCVSSDKGLIKPDLIIYLKADPKVLSRRSNYG
jgi:dTMP kinase